MKPARATALLLLTLALAPLVPPAGADAVVSASRPITVVAVIDSGFSPYHMDFVGSKHPWNRDADPANDFNFSADPATYIPGFPGATRIQLTLPTTNSQSVSTRFTGVDAAAWSAFRDSSATTAYVHWFPGTKIVAALNFTGSFYSDNSAHGTRSAASAAGNWHGTCSECVFVLIQGSNDDAMRWATSQPWIDVITNSYGQGGIVQSNTAGLTRDNMYWQAPVNRTRDAAEAGQVIVFSSGNGLVNAFDVPMLTYWSSQKGPDWMVTVGAVAPGAEQTYSGAGKPVDISSIGSSYPSTGGTTANGTGTHSGTSNAAPTTAGYFAKVLQSAREALADTTVGHASGVVASGAPYACGPAVPACALSDGVFTRDELEDAVYHNVLPSPFGLNADTVWPSTPYNYYYQGHGALSGRMNGPSDYEAEWRQMVENVLGLRAALPRPAGEGNWMVVDSKCRQHVWGAWGGGYYQGTVPPLDPVADPIATAWNGLCDAIPPHPFGYGRQ